jgi:hypothetical protein
VEAPGRVRDPGLLEAAFFRTQTGYYVDLSTACQIAYFAGTRRRSSSKKFWRNTTSYTFE